MSELLDGMGAALLDASLAATAIAGLVVLVMIQCRQPARRRDWARAGLLSTLALFPLAALNPVPRLDLRDTLRSVLATNLDEPRPAAEFGSVAGSFRTIDHGDCPTDHDRTTHPPGRPPWPRRIARGLVLIYLAGVAIGLGGIALGIAGSAWLIRTGRNPTTSAMVLHQSLPFGPTWRRPRLLVTDRATRPVLVGWIGPAILIPPTLDGPGASERLRLSLLHELAHAESLDHLFAPLSALARAIWFYLPPVWWVLDQMKLDQEFLADHRAVVHFGTSGGYASSLVDLASPSQASRAQGSPSSAAAGLDGPTRADVGSTLLRRVTMLLRCPFDLEGRTPLWWRWSTACILALATIAASCLTLRGMAGWSSPSETLPERVSGSYRQSDLVITQRPNDDQPFDLRFRLPDRFILTFEILAEPGDLPGIEVLGHRLGVAQSPDRALESYRLWHRVRIERSDGAETVTVDGQPISRRPDLAPTRLAPWLTIRPVPGMTTRLRDLELAW